jgi:hypothetical protein
VLAAVRTVGTVALTASGACVFGGMIEAARGRVRRGIALIVVGTVVGAVLAAATA